MNVIDTSRFNLLLPKILRKHSNVGQPQNRQERREFNKLIRRYKTEQYQKLLTALSERNIIAFDLGKTSAHYYNATEDAGVDASVVTHEQFLKLDVPGLKRGSVVIIEKAHLGARNPRSKSQTFEYEELFELFELAEERGILIYAFPHRQTPKARGFIFGTGEKPASDYYDCKAIAEYCIRHPNLASLSEFIPISDEQFEHLKDHKSDVVSQLNDEINQLRAVNYEYAEENNAFHHRIASIRQYLFEKGDDEIRDVLQLEEKKAGGLKKNKTSHNRTSDLAILFFRIDGTVRHTTLPTWNYTKQHYLGCSPYRQKAGVTASNIKYWLHSKLKQFRVARPLINREGTGKTASEDEKKAYAPWDATTQVELTQKRGAFWVLIKRIWTLMRDYPEIEMDRERLEVVVRTSSPEPLAAMAMA